MYSETKINNNQFQNLINCVLFFLKLEYLWIQFQTRFKYHGLKSKLIILQPHNPEIVYTMKLAQIRSCAH